MNNKYFKITDLVFEIVADNEIVVDPETRPFVTDHANLTDAQISITIAEKFDEISAKGHWNWNRLYCKEDLGTVHIVDKVLDSKYAEVKYKSREQIEISCLENYSCFHTAIVLNLLGLEHLLIQYDAMLLHSSFIRHNGKAILFSAPSGTGKSTQAALWEQCLGADIINGDRAGLRKVDGIWRAYGLPFAGSSGIYRNESAPIGAIIILRQGIENEIHPLSASQAFRALFPEISVQRWDDDFVNQVTDMLLDLLGRIPAYQLTCRPDEGAVRLLEETLRRDIQW